MEAEVDNQHLTAVRYKIDELLRLVESGRIRIPRFQRPLRWGGSDVEYLFDSIYRGFPVGTLLFWVKEAEAETVRLGPVVVEAPATSLASWVVDGQQRITALAASLLPATEPSADQRFEISFDLETEKFVQSRPGDPDHRIPVRAAYDLQRVLGWLKERDLAPHLQERAFKLADRLRNYEIPAYEVSTDDEKALQTIFDRTNTFGKSMTKAEVFRALNTSSTEPKADLATLDHQIAELGYGTLVGNTLLYSVLASRGPDVLREFRNEFNDKSNDQIKALEDTFEAAERVIVFLRDRADVPHFSLVPYQYQTVGLMRFFALHPDPDDHVLVLLRRWFWQAAEAGPIARLGNSGTLRATTTAIQPEDAFASVKALLELSSSPAASFEIRSYRWTSAATRVTVCALAHLDPIDLQSDEPIDVTRAVEVAGRDALVPIIGTRLETGLANTAANRMFVSPSDGLSESELSDRLARSERRILDSHCIPPEAVPLLGSDDEGFLRSRSDGVQTWVDQFLDARTERDKRARPPLAHYVTNG